MSTSTLPLHILNRLVLAKYFVREAKAKLQHSSDDLALSLVVVNFHDGLDNLLGAVASSLGVQLSERAYLVSTFEEISKVDSMPGKTEVVQLNTLRIDTKHKGLVPNPKTVLSLAPVLEELCDYICDRFFKKPLMQISVIDAIEDAGSRKSMAQIEAMIDRGDYRDVLESMAFVIFRTFEYRYAHGGIGMGGPFSSWTAMMLGQKPTPPEEQKQVFPSPGVDVIHQTFLEMGIEPDLYYRFHNIVPKVGYDNMRDKNLILQKERSTWHSANWTQENCVFCFDFLVNFLVRKQKGYRGYTILRKYWDDEVKFVRDSTVYEDMAGKKIAVEKKSGESLIGAVHDYVDGQWQGDSDDPLGTVLVSEDTPESVRFLYIRKSDVEIIPDREVGYYDPEEFAKREQAT